MRRSGIKIMSQLIGLIYPLLPIMFMAVFLGVSGFLCAIFITVTAVNGLISQTEIKTLLGILLLLAILRGVLHYGEQYCNHYIAFKLLAIIRNKVFEHLRKLAPAKLEGKDKGNLISIITSDIELLEVFYAHTVSPIAIGFITSLIMVVYIAKINFYAGMIALTAYVMVGVFIPLMIGKWGKDSGIILRNKVGDLNSFVLDSLRGLDEIIQYDDGKERRKKTDTYSKEIINQQKDLNSLEANQRAITNFTILTFVLLMLVYVLILVIGDTVGYADGLIMLVALMSSFGPVVALSNLSNNLSHTLASGERVLSLLEETPLVSDVVDKNDINFENAKVSNVTFSYKDEIILDNFSLDINKNEMIGIYGASGSGKSTLLKLLMRFWKVNEGQIKISEHDINDINTVSLRDNEAYVTQETYLFNDTIFNNIALGKKNASMEEVVEASKKASIHDFIITLKDGYDTKVGELGDILSGGEKQRIGIARAFLHDAPFILLDEPTSNLDSLNEGIILKSLKDSKDDKTIILVSHRKSTLNFADRIYKMESGRKT